MGAIPSPCRVCLEWGLINYSVPLPRLTPMGAIPSPCPILFQWVLLRPPAKFYSNRRSPKGGLLPEGGPSYMHPSALGPRRHKFNSKEGQKQRSYGMVQHESERFGIKKANQIIRSWRARANTFKNVTDAGTGTDPHDFAKALYLFDQWLQCLGRAG